MDSDQTKGGDFLMATGGDFFMATGTLRRPPRIRPLRGTLSDAGGSAVESATPTDARTAVLFARRIEEQLGQQLDRLAPLGGVQAGQAWRSKLKPRCSSTQSSRGPNEGAAAKRGPS